MFADKGKPCSAYFIAGAKSSPRLMLPNLRFSSAQVEGAPGTVTESQPEIGTFVKPARLTASAFKARGEAPLPFRAKISPFVHTMANASLPMLLLVGSNNGRAAAIATAASIALPPLLSISAPAALAWGMEVQTIPLLEKRVERREGYISSYTLNGSIKNVLSVVVVMVSDLTLL